MKTIQFLSIICTYIIIASCNNIKKEDLKVIENITLGKNVNATINEMDSLMLENSEFYTEMFMMDKSEIEKSKLNFYYTKSFDKPNHKPGDRKHIGLLLPKKTIHNSNVESLYVLLGYTGSSYFLTDKEFIDISDLTKIDLFVQNIYDLKIEEITKLFIEKYGKPNEIIENGNASPYVISGENIIECQNDSNFKGEILIWHTKYYDINFFKGIKSPNSSYNLVKETYTTYFDNNPDRNIEEKKGEIPCKSFSYVEYKLNEKAVKKLNLYQLNI